MLITLDHLEGPKTQNLSSMSQRTEHSLTWHIKKYMRNLSSSRRKKYQFKLCKPRIKKYRHVQELGNLSRKSTQTRISHN